MPGNSFGTIFKLTTFGESHGAAIGGSIDGCPAGLEIDVAFVQSELERRKPGQSNITTQRKEEDKVKFLSGIFEGKTTGTPIGFIIENKDQKSEDYDKVKDVFRPSHADFTYQEKYGIRDHRGGGRSSARETACRIVGGAIAKLVLKKYKISINAYVSCVGTIKVSRSYKELDLSKTENNSIRCPDEATASKMIAFIEEIKKQGDTIGGIVTCVATKVPVGLGEPVFDKLHADLGKAMLSINAVKGFEYGAGFDAITKRGSELNDKFSPLSLGNPEDSMTPNKEINMSSKGPGVRLVTNNSGGVQGGISNGEDIYFNVAFKPVATIMQKQNTINTKHEAVEMQATGRHDPCVLPRAVPIVESMCALVLVDHLLRARTSQL